MTSASHSSPIGWGRGKDGQRLADLGDGRFLNPILAGDHPDPSILKDGSDYYLTCSTFEAYPGVLLWHSRDMVNWTPLGPALKTNIGSVWAPELCKHNGRFFIYLPTKETDVPGTRTTCWVIWSDAIEGPWSDPVDLRIPNHIDPGHAVAEDGSRWLFLSAGDRIRLTDDGLATIGEPEHVYDPWVYPEDWVVEALSLEGPKLLRHGSHFYLIVAVGGTAGPPTGHMIVAARSESLHGPWEHHPRNPLVRTQTVSEKWWSRGHATLVEGPAGDWWSVYHGYEQGFWTLGRQALLAPVTWSPDGWPDIGGGDLAEPIAKPQGGQQGPHGFALSDDFEEDRYGVQWTFFGASENERDRIKLSGGSLHLKGQGTSPANSAPLLHVVGDQAYEFECRIDAGDGAIGGLVLFYDRALYCGLSIAKDRFVFHKYGIEHSTVSRNDDRPLWLRVRNDRHVISLYLSTDGTAWTNFGRGIEVSGYHHNVRGGFHMLKPGIYAGGHGTVHFSDYAYRALP